MLDWNNTTKNKTVKEMTFYFLGWKRCTQFTIPPSTSFKLWSVR